MEKHAVITGGAGFIGSHLVDALMEEGGWRVTVVDNFHPNYPRSIKEANLAPHFGRKEFQLIEGDVRDTGLMQEVLAMSPGPDTVVVHLAALTGVRPSVADPLSYHSVNTTGTLQLLECTRQAHVGRFILASSSSVYGEDPSIPWREDLPDLHPVSPYAASKLAAEEFIRVYSRLHGLDATVLRFFTVYGPRQRPDLAIHAFYRAVMEGRPIKQFGDGSSARDYTYVADVVRGLRSAMEQPRPAEGGLFRIYNLGHSEMVLLRELIAAIARQAGRAPRVEVMPAQPGDLSRTCADPRKAKMELGFEARTALEEGLARFASWYASADGPTAAAMAGNPAHAHRRDQP